MDKSSQIRGVSRQNARIRGVKSAEGGGEKLAAIPTSFRSRLPRQTPCDSGIFNRHGTGSLGYRVNGSSFTSGSPGHHLDPV